MPTRCRRPSGRPGPVGGGGLGLARVRVSRVRFRASRVRVLARRETAQAAGTRPRSKGPPFRMPTRRIKKVRSNVL